MSELHQIIDIRSYKGRKKCPVCGVRPEELHLDGITLTLAIPHHYFCGVKIPKDATNLDPYIEQILGMWNRLCVNGGIHREDSDEYQQACFDTNEVEWRKI